MKNIPIKLIENSTYCVNYLVYSDDNNKRAFLYIASRKDQMPSLKEAIKRGNFIAEDYGIILEHGDGEAPEHIKEKMHILYNCNHEGSISINDYEEDDN